MPDDVDNIWDDPEWQKITDEINKEQEEREKNRIPIGSDIQIALRDECLKVSPYVRIEVGMDTRFDLVMYLPEPMPFIADKPEIFHCWQKFRRIYCKKIWEEVKGNYEISLEERQERKEQWKKDNPNQQSYYMTRIPRYRYKGKEYDDAESFWKSNAKKELAICDQPNCEWYKNQVERETEEMQKYGFMNGLHIFEVKSDKDKHDLLLHQIPNMVAIADYVWLVLGENQPTPEWLPPYISVLRHNGETFEIEYMHEIKITQHISYANVFRNHGYIIDNQEKYAFHSLMRKWKINSMFHFMFEGQVVIDMQEDIENLLKFLRRADKNKTKHDYEGFQQNLFKYIGNSGSEGSGTNGK